MIAASARPQQRFMMIFAKDGVEQADQEDGGTPPR